MTLIFRCWSLVRHRFDHAMPKITNSPTRIRAAALKMAESFVREWQRTLQRGRVSRKKCFSRRNGRVNLCMLRRQTREETYIAK